MDPVTAFGLLVNVATFIDLGVKAIGIYRDGVGPNHTRLVESADEMEGLCQQLQSTKIMSQATASGSIEADLQDCAKRCIEKATALRKRLDLPTKLASKRQRALESVRVQFSRKIPQLERDLQGLRVELDTKLLVSIRYVACDVRNSWSLKRSDGCRETINVNELKQTDHFKSLDASIQNALVRFCDSQSTALDLVLDRSTRKIFDRINEVQKIYIENGARKDLERRKSKILESLIHGNPFTRENHILGKHDGTFEWIFDEGPETGSTFLSWLRSPADGGIFWIQGKPGSGKSTLMKFLCTSTDRIEQCLHKFATAKTPVFLVLLLARRRGKAAKYRERLSLLRQKKTQGNWDVVELRSLVVLAADTLLIDHTVYVFVDGLDECQAEDLLKVLNMIKQFSNRGVKICVSSRPESRIVNRLEPDAADIIKVDFYTRNDIANFVDDEFDGVNLSVVALSQEDLKDLADRIIENADGVFLWATLVAKDVCKGIENGDDVDQLYRRVNQTPGDLDALYKNMLSRLGPDENLYIAEATCYFSLVSQYESKYLQGDMPLVYCLSAYQKFRESGQGNKEPKLDLLLPRVESRICVVCAGMLVCGQRLEDYVASDPTLRDRTVRFIHRTARDFFLDCDNQVMRSGSLSLYEYFHTVASGVSMACGTHGIPPRVANDYCVFVIRDLAWSRLKPADKVKLLLSLNASMQEISRTKHWLYRQLLDGRVAMDTLDLVSTALSSNFDLLDHFRESGASLSLRYKSYLLSLACNSAYCNYYDFPHTYQDLLSSGGDPNQTMFTSSSFPFRAKTSPWIQYLASRTYPDIRPGSPDIRSDVVQMFIEGGANLKEISLWHTSLPSVHGYMHLEFGIQSGFPPGGIDIVLLANTRYVAEGLLGRSLQTMFASELPAAYCKILGFISEAPITTPTDLSATDQASREEDMIDSVELSRLQHHKHLYLFSEDLLSAKDRTISTDASEVGAPETSLHGLLRDIQHSFPQTPVDGLDSILDVITEYRKHTSSVPFLTWALENGYFIKDTDPAALFPDYEKFRGEDGFIDLDALFAD
ncbi:hypothetical protein ASPCAL06013 [Aspergillus calidoustus]|uniref:NACHT domain-containing protein n=1 Tax=Aspergillus calidoustus TaxID=454130 RepID=A0A0U5C8E2_ASPCI|nr:hypothetical protein ASPCAL06013 [Aspergillus calidoustus]